MKPSSWAHPEGKRGTHAEYARRGAYNQPLESKARRSGEVDRLRAERLEAEKERMRELGIID